MFKCEADFAVAKFQNEAGLEGAEFNGEASFGGARFGGRAEFRGAVFKSQADFGEASFALGPGADFSETVFLGEANFWRATFGRADFVGTQFRREAVFRQATFGGAAQFGAATLGDTADFGPATSGSVVDVRPATFEGAADFGAATFADAVTFVGSGDSWVFCDQDHSDANFRDVRFDQPQKVAFQDVFLGRARFLGTDVRRVAFTKAEWARRAGYSAVWDELAPEDEGQQKDFALIGNLYRQLKYNYEERRDPITAGDFHFGEMHMRRLSEPPKNGLLRFLKRNLSFLALYRWISGYGEDYLLPLAWIAAVIVLFALGFAYLPALALETSPGSAAPQPVHGLWPRLLHSLMCFLLRPDKPLRPVHLLGHYASVAEGVVGAPLVAMFVLALNRRFKR